MSSDQSALWNSITPQWTNFIRSQPDGGWARHHLLHPALLAMGGPVEGKAVLDAGCGEGYLARKLASSGARTTGVDFAIDMLTAALEMERAQPLGITYLERSITDLRGIASDEFDLAFCVFVLPAITDLDAAFAELARVLKVGGRLVTAVAHPAFDGLGPGWVQVCEELRPVQSRYSEVVEGRQGMGAIVYHRPISSYVNSAALAGFVVVGMQEPVLKNEISQALPTWERETDRIPSILVTEHIKR